MAHVVTELGDATSRECKPDFGTGKGWAWEKMTREAIETDSRDNLPHKPRRTLAEHSFWGQVDRHMSRSYHTQSFYLKDGKVIRE